MDRKEIISLRKRIQQEKYSSIHDPVTYINGKRYHFIEQALPAGNLLIYLPQEFVDMPAEIARQKYPSENRPKMIKTSMDISINFAFQMMPAGGRDEDMILVRNAALDALKRLYPHYAYLDTGMDNFGPKKKDLYCWFEYCGPTLSSDIYSFNAFMAHNDTPVFFLFSCPKDSYEGWRQIVFEVIDTIRDKPIGWKGAVEK